MREIKFRAWDRFKQRWSNYKINDGTVYFMDKNTGIWYGSYNKRYKDFNLMQYTGLKDEYGDEIYEGDIVTLHNSKYKVIFNSKEARFVLKDAFFEMDIPFTNNNNERMEIVGNIYENPELMEERIND